MISHIIRILFAWRIFIISGSLICLVVAVVVALQYPAVYRSTARVYVDVPGPSSGRAAQRSAESYLASQMELATDYTIGERAVDLGGFSSSEDMLTAYQAAVPDQSIDYRRWLGTQLVSSVGIDLNFETNTLEMTYVAASPTTARAMATLMRTAYVEETKSRLQWNSQREKAWLTTQTEKIGEALRLAQERKVEFERANNVLVTRSGISTDEMRLNSAATTLPPPSAFRAQETAVAVAPSQVALSEITAKIEGAKASIGPNHPAMIAMREQQEALQKAVSTELAAQRNNAPKAIASGPSPEATIARGLPNAEKIAEAKRLQDDINVLEAQYASFKMRAADANVKAAAPDNGVEEIGEATFPTEPFFPNWPVVIGLSFLLGFVLSSLVALLTELLNLRISHENELTSVGPPLLNSKIASDEPVKLTA